MCSLSNKTFFITGASRGIGKYIALKLAAKRANIIVAAKSITEHPRLEGTIFSAAEEVKQAGGNALALQCDIRDEKMIQEAIERAVKQFGKIDSVINNASALSLTDTAATESKRYDLMMDINVRGAFLVTRSCLPYLKLSDNPHILNLSPPLNLKPKWMAPHIAYSISKYNMTMLAMGWAEEFRESGIAANSLWPATTIATAAIQNLLGGPSLMKKSRKPEIVADAAYFILQQNAKTYTGQQLIDEEVLHQAGIFNLDDYAVDASRSLQKDLFID